MFRRISTTQNLCKIYKHILMTQRPNAKLLIVQKPKQLHVKTFDKDAEIKVQRVANTYSNVDEAKRENDRLLPKNEIERNCEFNRESNLKENIFCKINESPPEKLLFKKINDDADVFGNAPKDTVQEDEGDLEEEEYISRPIRRSKQLRTTEYARMIKDHLNNHRLKEAIEVLETRILKEDRAKPDTYIYNLLISGCAKAGYTRKAFHLFNKMRQRGLKVKESTYTSLFNACANAPSRQDGLTRAIRLRESLLDCNYEFNTKNYNAMIKTFGRWGDVKTSYILADEMRDKNIHMTAETFNFLLQACASDEKNGFRYCLLTWNKMLKKKIQPDYYSFNAVLRCVRDCGFGDLDAMENVLQQILSPKPSKYIEPKILDSGIGCISVTAEDEKNNSVSIKLPTTDNSLQIKNDAIRLELPNLLGAQPHLGSMVSLREVQKPHDRFLLIGGLTGFLEHMKSKNITPDIQTFTTMLEVIPPTNAAEKQLLTFIRKIGLKADIDFFNILIKKRAMRFDYEGGKEVLSMIRTAGLYPDIVTYGVLALGCTTIEESRELLEQMRHNGIRMNIQILGAMLRQGCAKKNFNYICEIIQISLDENIKPNDIFLKHLHNFHLQCARAIDSRHPTTKTKYFKKDHKKFCDKYRLYQEEHGIDGLKLEDAIKKVNERPYNQYKEIEMEGMEPLKNEKLSKKQKLRKYIKKIKIQNLNDDKFLQTGAEALYQTNMTTDKIFVSLQESNSKEDDKNQCTENQIQNPFRIV